MPQQKAAPGSGPGQEPVPDETPGPVVVVLLDAWEDFMRGRVVRLPAPIADALEAQGRARVATAQDLEIAAHRIAEVG